MIFAILALYALKSNWNSDRKLFLLLIAWLLIPGLFALLGSIFSNQPFNTRYILLIFPAVLLLWAQGLSRITGSVWQIACLVLFIGINGFSLYNHYFNSRYAKEDNRAAGTYFKTHASPHDLAICSAFYAKKGLEYYARHPESNLIGYRPDKRETRPQKIFADLQEILDKRQSFWLYLSRNFNARQVKLIRQYCDKNYVRVIDKYFTGVELTYYKKVKRLSKVQ